MTASKKVYILIASVTFVILDDFARDWLFTNFTDTQLLIASVVGLFLLYNYYVDHGKTPT